MSFFGIEAGMGMLFLIFLCPEEIFPCFRGGPCDPAESSRQAGEKENPRGWELFCEVLTAETANSVSNQTPKIWKKKPPINLGGFKFPGGLFLKNPPAEEYPERISPFVSFWSWENFPSPEEERCWQAGEEGRAAGKCWQGPKERHRYQKTLLDFPPGISLQVFCWDFLFLLSPHGSFCTLVGGSRSLWVPLRFSPVLFPPTKLGFLPLFKLFLVWFL